MEAGARRGLIRAKCANLNGESIWTLWNGRRNVSIKSNWRRSKPRTWVLASRRRRHAEM
jgi:hypothetical protein